MSDRDNGEGSRPGQLSPAERKAFRARSNDLGARLDAVKSRRLPPPDDAAGRARGSAMAQGFKIAVDLIVGVCFGGLLGWGLDRYFETNGPWFLIVFVMLGFAAGMLNVIRTAQRMQAEAEKLQKSAPSVVDGDDEA
ncbi:MAG: AtpZ/AtpI family protein [Hyphomicrobiaceae bacterium]